MGDKTGTETLKINVPRSVASPGAKDRKKTATDTPGALTTDVLGRRPRVSKRATVTSPTPTSGLKDPGFEVPPELNLSHKPGHRRSRQKRPRTAAQKRATLANFKKMMAARK